MEVKPNTYGCNFIALEQKVVAAQLEIVANFKDQKAYVSKIVAQKALCGWI